MTTTNLPITLLDFIVLGVMLVSAVLAMVRGFTREVLSIASWAAAAAATIYFFPQVRDWARTEIHVEPKILADVIAGAGIFLVTLILVSLVTMRISDMILDSRIGPLDRSLGFVYGAARGFLLAIVAFLFFGFLVNEQAQPNWVKNSRSKPLLEGAGQALLAALPSDLESTISKRLKGIGGSGDPTVVPDGDPAKTPPGNTTAPGNTSGSNSGYKPSERQTMQRLLDTTKAQN